MLDECLLAVNGMGCGYMCGGAGEGGEKSRVWSGIESRGHRPDIDRLLSRKQVGECGTGWMGWVMGAVGWAQDGVGAGRGGCRLRVMLSYSYGAMCNAPIHPQLPD